MDNSLTPRQQTILVEDALNSFPTVPMPRDITADVMARIQTIPAPRPFRLMWSDFALALVLSLCIGAIWFSVDHLPPIMMAQIRKETILFYQRILVNARWLIPATSFGIAGFLSALTIPYLRKELMKKSS